MPLYAVFFYFCALGATWSNGGAHPIQNILILWLPVLGFVICGLALFRNKKLGMRILAILPLIFFGLASAYMILWTIKN